MGIISDTKVGKIEFCENHVAPWTANSVAMGSTAPAVSSWSALVTSARAAYAAQQAAQSAAKDATTDLNLALQAMMDATSSIIKQVRAKADLVGDSVYSLASLPVPATPAPKPAPGKSTDFVATMEEDGALNLTWQCPNPPGTSGTIYQVYRRTTPTGEFDFLGAAGVKEFVDATIPAGSSQVTYKLRAIRSTSAGPWATFNVTFGVGSVTTSVVETSAGPKVAA